MSVVVYEACRVHTRRLHMMRIRHWVHIRARHKRGSLARHDHRWLAMGLDLKDSQTVQWGRIDLIDVPERHKDTAVDNT